MKELLIQSYRDTQLAEIRAKTASDKLTGKETEERFYLFFGRKPDSVSGMKAVCEGITFIRNCGHGGSWQIENLCRECKTGNIVSGGSTKEEIGKILSQTPSLCYNCRNKETQSQLSTEDKLLQVLRDFVYEHSQSD